MEAISPVLEFDDVKYYASNQEDVIYQRMRESGHIYDHHTLKKLCRYIKRDSCVVDAGGHIGNHSMQFAKSARKVFAFEPVRQNYEIFEKNMKLNCIDNVQLFKFALADKPGRLKIDPQRQRLSVNSGATFLIPEENGDIEAKPLDDVMASVLSASDSISLIKYDVEEMEYEALLGSRAILQAFRPVLYVEMYPASNWNRVKEDNNHLISCFLKDLGYVDCPTKEGAIWTNRCGK